MVGPLPRAGLEIVFPSFVLYLVMVYGEQGSPRMSSPESIKSSQDFLTACGVRLVATEISPPGSHFFWHLFFLTGVRVWMVGPTPQVGPSTVWVVDSLPQVGPSIYCVDGGPPPSSRTEYCVDGGSPPSSTVWGSGPPPSSTTEYVWMVAPLPQVGLDGGPPPSSRTGWWPPSLK